MSAQKFILERSLLQPADIILTRDKTLVSLGVQLGTIGRYSHAALYVGGTAIEATLEGVFSKNPQRMIFDRSTDVLILRAKKNISSDEARIICSYAQSKVGSLYALNEAITMKARSFLNHKDSKQQFCSRLVAVSFQHANFDLVNLRHPAFCTPRQISSCLAFRRVTGIVRPAHPEEVRFANTEDPAQTNFRQIYQWLNKTRALVNADPSLAEKWDIQTQNDVNDFLLAHPEYDKEVSTSVAESGYLDFYKIEEQRNPYRYNADLFWFHLAHAEDAEEFLDSEIDKERDLIHRHTTMQEAFCKLIEKNDLLFFRQHIDLYTNLVSDIAARVKVIRTTLLRCDLDVDDFDFLLEVLSQMIHKGRNLLAQKN
jgi:hypothetical protein